MYQQKEISGRARLSPLTLLLCGGVTMLCGLLSTSLGLLFFAALALATALQALSFRCSRFALPLIFTALALLLSYAVGNSCAMLLPVAAIPLAAYCLARTCARGENRATVATSLAGVYATAFLAAAAAVLALLMYADGEQDVLSYLDRTLSQTVDGVAAQLADYYKRMAELYASVGTEIGVIAEADIREMLLTLLSILPALLLSLCYLLGLAATYLVQLSAMLCGNGALFTQQNRAYRPSAWLAGAYLFAMPVAFAWGDFRQAFCLVCMNVAVFSTPVLAFGALKQVPRVFAFMRRMSVGRLDFLFFAVLLCLFVFSYALYALPVLAVAYAIYILKSTHSRRKGTRR